MDFNVSVGDDDQDIRILAPWFLNCLNRLSGSNPAKFILKQQVFAQTPMNGFKADPEKYQKYGVDKCNEPTDIEWSYNHTFYPIEDDEDIAKNPGYRNYK